MRGARGVSEFISLLIAGVVTGLDLRRQRQRPGGDLQHHRHLQLRPRGRWGWSWPICSGSCGRAGTGRRCWPWPSSSSWPPPILGALIERVVMRPLYGVSTNIRLAVTLGLLLVLVALANIDLEPVERLQHAGVLRRRPGLDRRCQPLLRAAHHRRRGRGRRRVPAAVLQAHPHRRGHAGRGRRPQLGLVGRARPRDGSPPTPG